MDKAVWSKSRGGVMRVYETSEQAFLGELSLVSEQSEIPSRAGGTTKELLFSAFEITDPTAINITLPERNFSKDYAFAEFLWYLSEDRSSKDIGKLASIWNKIKSPEDDTVESNYGSLISPRWESTIDLLLTSPETRRATIPINQPQHHNKNPLDYPCTQYIQVLIRDNKLHWATYMRSNDIVFGLCNDVFTFCLFQQLLLNELRSRGAVDLELGSYYHSATSMHLYKRHYKMAEKILSSKHKKVSDNRVALKSNVHWDDSARSFWPAGLELSGQGIFGLIHLYRVQCLHD
jgi:thymidylate synthase